MCRPTRQRTSLSTTTSRRTTTTRERIKELESSGDPCVFASSSPPPRVLGHARFSRSRSLSRAVWRWHHSTLTHSLTPACTPKTPHRRYSIRSKVFFVLYEVGSILDSEHSTRLIVLYMRMASCRYSLPTCRSHPHTTALHEDTAVCVDRSHEPARLSQ